MSSLHYTIYHLWVRTPILYILLATVPYLLCFLVMWKNRENTGQTAGNILILFWIAVSAAEAYLLNNARRTPTKGIFWILFIVIFAASAILLVKLNDSADDISAKSKAKARKKRMLKALKEEDFETLRETVDTGITEELKDPVLLGKAVKFCSKTDSLSPLLYSRIAAMTDRDTAKELLMSKSCAEPFRKALYKIYPEWIDYSDPDRLIQNALQDGDIAKLLRDNLDKISDPIKLRQAINAVNALSDRDAVKKILPRLTYPEDAGILRTIVTNVGTLEKSLRKQAFDRIPPEDEAHKKAYCPFCGSSDIKSGYMGLEMDMFFYGYRCNRCGHESKAPEGMGTARAFAVSFPDLVK